MIFAYFIFAFLFNSLGSPKALAASDVYNSGGGAYLIINWVNDQKMKERAAGLKSSKCKKFNREEVTFVAFECQSDPKNVKKEMQAKLDRDRPEIRRMAELNSDIKEMKKEQDLLLENSLNKWFSTCQAAKMFSKELKGPAPEENVGACIALENAAALDHSAAAAKEKMIKVMEGTREEISKSISDRLKKDRQTVYGVNNRILQLLSDGKAHQRELENLYSSSGFYESFLRAMDNEICLNAESLLQLQTNASYLNAERENCKSAK